LVGEDRLAVHQHVEYVDSGEAHLGLQIQLLPDFPFEAPGLQQNGESGKAAFDLDGQDYSVPSSEKERESP
jgi:hypothetical protein